ncbi:MAG: FAD-dependent oxidoreductase [Turneriella sp.]
MKSHIFDIAVLGAGPAGAASALFLAQAGFRVALVEKRSFAHAGPSWVNGIYLDSFNELGLARPSGGEIDLADFGVLFFSADMQHRLALAPSAFTNVRMRPFVDRLHREAFAAGVAGFDEMHLVETIFTGERPVEMQFVHGAAETGTEKECLSIRAKLFVDATGLHAALRRQIPALHEIRGEHTDSDLCTAFQENCHIADIGGARSFLRRHKIEPGTLVSILGTNGGYSTMTVHISPDLKEVGLLAGASKDAQLLTGPQMLKRFRDENSWVGERILGGGGTIPLRTPLELLSAPGVAVVGMLRTRCFLRMAAAWCRQYNRRAFWPMHSKAPQTPAMQMCYGNTQPHSSRLWGLSLRAIICSGVSRKISRAQRSAKCSATGS